MEFCLKCQFEVDILFIKSKRIIWFCQILKTHALYFPYMQKYFDTVVRKGSVLVLVIYSLVKTYVKNYLYIFIVNVIFGRRTYCEKCNEN